MTDSAPLVSVCIANYNGMAVIDECVCSVLAQSGGISVEILIHDDASSDSTAAYIRDRYPDIKLIESIENVGFCVANNRMAAIAKGKYLLLLNNDAALFKDALETLISEASRLNQPAIFSLPQYEAASSELLDIGSLFDPFLNPFPNLDPLREEVGMVMGACLMIPKSMWIELGGFPEWFDSIAEDMYLCCRARLLGYSVIALSRSGYYHHVGHSFGGGKIRQNRLITSKKRRALSERNKSFIMIMSYPTLYFEIIFPLHILALAVEGLVLASIKRNVNLWNDIYFSCFKALWQKRAFLQTMRSEIQRERRSSSKKFFSVFKWLPHKLRMLYRHGVPTIKQ